MAVYNFQMEMTCEGCTNAVKRVLDKLGDKIIRVDIDLAAKRVQVESNELSQAEVLEQIKKCGKTVNVVEN